MREEVEEKERAAKEEDINMVNKKQPEDAEVEITSGGEECALSQKCRSVLGRGFMIGTVSSKNMQLRHACYCCIKKKSWHGFRMTMHGSRVSCIWPIKSYSSTAW